MTASQFELREDIHIADANCSIDIYVDVQEGQGSLYHDREGKYPYLAHSRLYVAFNATCAVYFHLTAASEHLKFPQDPFDWLGNGRPATVRYEYMKPDHKAFSIQDTNTAQHTEDQEHPFDLLVDTGNEVIPLNLHETEIDPTILNKGEGSGGG